MDNTTYRYDALSKKYDGFTAPSYEVAVAGQQLESSRFRIDNLEVELVADGTAGGCSFTVEGMYDYEQGDWADELLSLVTLGAKLTVSAGYVQQREVFYGYVDDFSLEFSGDGTPRLQVTGIDGLGYLMSCRSRCTPASVPSGRSSRRSSRRASARASPGTSPSAPFRSSRRRWSRSRWTTGAS